MIHLPLKRQMRPRSSMRTMTPNMRRVYRYVCEYKATHDGNSPSYQEIREAIGCNSTSVVRDLVMALVAFGYFRMSTEGKALARRIEVVGARWVSPNMEGVPLAGNDEAAGGLVERGQDGHV